MEPIRYHLGLFFHDLRWQHLEGQVGLDDTRIGIHFFHFFETVLKIVRNGFAHNTRQSGKQVPIVTNTAIYGQLWTLWITVIFCSGNKMQQTSPYLV